MTAKLRRGRLVAAARAFAFALAFVACAAPRALAQSDAELQDLVAGYVQPWLADGAGAAVVVRRQGRTSFFNFGFADREARRRASSDDLFNLASVGKLFASTLLALGVARGELSLDDPVATYVTELQSGGDIRKVTLGQLASHTSGLPRGPGEDEPWRRGPYTLPDFIRYLNAWQARPGRQPGEQDIYSNSGVLLLRIALERRYAMPFAKLMEERILKPLGMASTGLPPLPAALKRRAVQGYGPGGRPLGATGGQEGVFQWRGAGQVYSSARDMAAFLVANLGELPGQDALEQAMAFSQQPVFPVNPRFAQALIWQVFRQDGATLVDKNGALPNTSTYIGLIRERGLGVAILCNRGRTPATRIGRQILLTLAGVGDPASAVDDGPD